MTFENLSLNESFYSALISGGIKIFLIFSAFYMLLVIFFPHYAKKVFPFFKFYMNIAKLLTCLIAVFFVFCFDYETKQVVFFTSLEKMSLSTFLVGALALWELLAMVTDIFSIINDSLPDNK